MGIIITILYNNQYSYFTTSNYNMALFILVNIKLIN